ncbi:MAG: alpha-hydroxy acid oxidase [Gemmatimonadaceae bacterium]
MQPGHEGLDDRRRFVRFLAASPVLAALGVPKSALERLLLASGEPSRDGNELLQQLAQDPPLLKSPDDALSVLDFEATAKSKLPPAHFGYMASGVDDDATLRANREGMLHWQLRPRRLVDVRTVDTSIGLLGERWNSPIVVCPTGSQRGFHADGELATARAARAGGHLMMLSGVTTTSVEAVNAARGLPVWYQLYPTDDERVAHAIVRRAQRAACPVLVLTVDLNAGRNPETQLRSARLDSRNCSSCHAPGLAGSMKRKPMFDGIDLSRATDVGDRGMTWEYVKRMRDVAPSMKLVIKGIVTREDAVLAVQHGIDAIVVSNHGGRAEESARGTIDSLPEVVTAVANRIPVLVDGGFRRGTDIFKALALGASAVGVGRPYLWGLAAFGQPGVEAVLGILRREFELVMRQAGVTRVAAISRAHVDDRTH